jgi:hypothetical protein
VGCTRVEITKRNSLMLWGCISYYGVGTLTPVVANLNSEKYINILDVFITFHTFSIIHVFKSGLCGGHSKVGISFSVFH